MSTRSQVKALVHAAMVAAGFRARGAVDALNMPHKHNDALVDGLYTAIESYHFKAFWNPSTGLPTNPVVGDAYIASATGNGWTIDRIYDWDGSAWQMTLPVEGMWVWIDSEDEFYKYDGTNWSLFTATIGPHYHDYLVFPNTAVPALYIDTDGGFVFVAADGTKTKQLYSSTGIVYYKWNGSIWVDLDVALQF